MKSLCEPNAMMPTGVMRISGQLYRGAAVPLFERDTIDSHTTAPMLCFQISLGYWAVSWPYSTVWSCH